MTKQIQKWADKAMFKAEEINPDEGPQVQLLSCNNDPLGTIAAAALMYEGKSVASLDRITDEQRRYYLEQVQKSVLEAPLEFVNFHFIISGVTRGFTHQMVRQRTATYTQESTRFAVKETVPVAPPPSLDGTISWPEWMWKCSQELFPGAMVTKDALTVEQAKMVQDYAFRQASKQQLWRREWDTLVEDIDSTYNALVSAGMPAEDARGLLPTNLLTRINYNTSLRGLKDHAGVRLCLQAQYEWRLVWKQILEAIREYGKTQWYTTEPEKGVLVSNQSAWQFDALAGVFKPICYAAGKCEFMANVDRFCGIRDRVEAHHKAGTPSDKWVDIDLQKDMWTNESGARVSQ